MVKRFWIVALAALALHATAAPKDKEDKVKDKGKVAVSLVVPAANASYTAPAAIVLTAEATSSQQNHPVTEVRFYRDAILIGTSTQAPYSLTWSQAAAGNYQLTATAINDKGDSASSMPVAINVNAPPTVSMTAPANNASYTGPANIVLTADAADSDGSIAKVDFFDGATPIGTVANAPYQLDWANVVPGNYRITAVATDNQGAATTSTAIAINVNAPPTVSLMTPTKGASYIAPATILLAAEAADSDGSIAKVDFFNGTTLLASVTDAPYMHAWSDAQPGDYAITARSTDDQGATATTAPVGIAVVPNQMPVVSLTADAGNGAAPATVTLNATATDVDGKIAKVDFFNGSTLLATITQAPYTHAWTDVAQGMYAVTAKATDNLGGTATSDAVTVSIASGVAQVYYIHADHLNTPRLITDSNNNTVWQWDNSDPFGNNVPVAKAGFEFNLRFPGQVFDKETNLHYNWHRFYDPQIGRFITTDPLGLAGGDMSLYAYAANNPIMFFDPDGRLCIYSQGTGSLSCTNDTTGATYLTCNGYAGAGDGRNNPDAQNQRNVGPIPQGDYTVGDSHRHAHAGAATRRLTPAATNQMFGRDGFLIHGDNATNDASQGCIIVPRSCRDSIPTGETVRVVR